MVGLVPTTHDLRVRLKILGAAAPPHRRL